jgi:hypothetical protein
MQNLRNIVLTSALALSTACGPGEGNGPRETNFMEVREKAITAANAMLERNDSVTYATFFGKSRGEADQLVQYFNNITSNRYDVSVLPDSVNSSYLIVINPKQSKTTP